MRMAVTVIVMIVMIVMMVMIMVVVMIVMMMRMTVVMSAIRQMNVEFNAGNSRLFAARNVKVIAVDV